MVDYKGYKIAKFANMFFIKRISRFGHKWTMCWTYAECKQLINERVRTSK